MQTVASWVTETAGEVANSKFRCLQGGGDGGGARSPGPHLSCSKTFWKPPQHLLDETCVRAIASAETGNNLNYPLPVSGQVNSKITLQIAIHYTGPI